MNYLFSKKGLELLRSFSPAHTLYAFDFDGTLSKIVRVPSKAKVTSVTVTLMKQLCHLAPIAIISGRSICDLKPRLGFEPQYLLGNHGLEGFGNSLLLLKRAKKICKQWKIFFEQKYLNSDIALSGIEIEDKTYSLSFHFRQAQNKSEAKLALQNFITFLQPRPQVIPGKSVLNLLPQGSAHKGTAVLKLLKHTNAKHIFYLGDDETDENVFRLSHAQVLGVRVGKKKKSQAQLYVKRQSEINSLLKCLIQNYHISRSVMQ